MSKRLRLAGPIAGLLFWGSLAALCATPVSAPVYGYRVVHVYPHDRDAFTQGLIYLDGFLYESTGLEGRSSLRKVKLETGQVLQKTDVPAQYFAEGLTDWKKSLLQLTWKSGIGFVYDLFTFKPQRTFAYGGEGWGLTHDGTQLIQSDGSESLRFINPETLRETGRVAVSDNGMAVENLNELEYIKGEVYANIWQQDRIAIIAPKTGKVVRWIDMSNLLSDKDRLTPVDVLNGIAYDPIHDRLFVTGKLWPKLFEIKVVSKK
jgi:glutaminyl-peptide cyclotransferase